MTWKESQIDWIVCRICRVRVHEDCVVNEVCFLCKFPHASHLILSVRLLTKKTGFSNSVVSRYFYLKVIVKVSLC